jgi:hypothetical protein
MHPYLQVGHHRPISPGDPAPVGPAEPQPDPQPSPRPDPDEDPPPVRAALSADLDDVVQTLICEEQ